MLEEIRRWLKRQPFKPFVIHLADGRFFSVPHPEFVWLPKPGALFVLHGTDEFGERINPLLIVSVGPAGAPRSKAKRK